MVRGVQRLGRHHMLRQVGIAVDLPPLSDGVIDDLFFRLAAVFLQHLAGVGIGKNRLDPGGDVPSVKTNRPRGRDGGQQRVANAMGADRIAHILIHRQHGLRLQVRLRLKQRERTLLLCQIDGGEVGRACDPLQPAFRLCGSLGRAVAQPNHCQSIRQPGDAQPDAALGLRLLRLRIQWKTAGIHHIVHHAHGGRRQLRQFVRVDPSRAPERIAHQSRKVDGAQQTRAIGRQGLLTAGVRGGDGLTVMQVVGAIDPVDENHTGLRVIVSRLHDPIPQGAGAHGAVGLPVEHQIPIGIGLHGLHEGVRHQHGDIEHPQPGRVRLRGDEILHIRVVAAHTRHHRPPAGACGHDRPTHRIPHIHEAQRARGIRRNPMHRSALGANGGEIISDPAALLHRQRGLFQHVENTAHAVGDRAHDKTVEQRHGTVRPSTGGNPARGQETEIVQRGFESGLPPRGILLHLRQGTGNPGPAVLYGAVNRRAVGFLQAIFHVPDRLGDRRCETAHG